MHTSCEPGNVTHTDRNELVWKLNDSGFSYEATYNGEFVGSVVHLSDGSWGASSRDERLHHRSRQYTLGEAMKCVEDAWKKGEFPTR